MQLEPQSMQKSDFLSVFGAVFEHSPWIAENVWERFAGQIENSAIGLHRQMCEVVQLASHDRKLALLNAHPELACALSEPGITSASVGEQTRSGLDQCSPSEYAEFQALNRAYGEKFGFPFILAIKGYFREEILEVFRKRLQNNKEDEFRTAIEQVMKIGLFRLQELLP